MTAPLVFDAAHYKQLNEARAAVVEAVLNELAKIGVKLSTAIDVGCGVGYFSQLLRARELSVLGVDGRAENVTEAKRRYAGIEFRRCDAEDAELATLGVYDLCFCFGLLYHLENPFLTIRRLRALTKSVLFVEVVTFPGDEPIMALIDEEAHEDQGLRYFAFYPTEACLVKMLYRSEFLYVYSLQLQPSHPEYSDSAGGRRTRTMLVASLQPLEAALFRLMPEPASKIRPWDPMSGIERNETLHKLQRFAGQPVGEKLQTLKRLIHKRDQK